MWQSTIHLGFWDWAGALIKYPFRILKLSQRSYQILFSRLLRLSECSYQIPFSRPLRLSECSYQILFSRPFETEPVLLPNTVFSGFWTWASVPIKYPFPGFEDWAKALTKYPFFLPMGTFLLLLGAIESLWFSPAVRNSSEQNFRVKGIVLNRTSG